jgi:predicted TIM-barrel fold metal-dependent hydrolase
MTRIRRRELLGAFATAAAAPPALAQAAASSPLDQARAGSLVSGMEVIDTHGHIDESAAGAVWPRGVDLLIEDMDRCGTRQIVVSHFGALQAVTAEALRHAHDQSAQAAARHPGRIRAYIVFQPWLRDASRAELDRILAPDAPFVGIKLHGAIHAYPADGPAYRVAFEFADQHSLPVLFHVAQGLEAIGGIAERHPRMKLIVAHYAGGNAAILKRVRELPNLFVDTCTSNGPRRIVERLADACGPEKILYGSDSVYLCMGSQIARVAFAAIPDADKRRIYTGNARAIFGSRLAPPA